MLNIIDLSEKTKDELYQMAADLVPYIGKQNPGLSEQKLRDIVEVGLLKRQKALESQATEEANSDRLRRLGAKGNRKTHPSPETVAIEHSKKVYCVFVNMENPGQDGNPGADLRFWKGDKYQFHLFDGQRHVMPLCVISSNPEAEAPLLERMTKYWSALGFRDEEAVKQAKGSLRETSLPCCCRAPRAETRIDPKTQMPRTVLAGHTSRFMFTEISDAPASSEFGLVVNEAKDA